MSKEYEIPGGRTKGTPLRSAKEEDILYWVKAKEERLADDPDHQWAEGDRSWLSAAKTELARRASGGGGPQPARARTIGKNELIYACLQGSAAYDQDPYDIARRAVGIAEAVMELTGQK